MSKRHAKIRLPSRLLVSLSDESFAQHRVFADQLSTSAKAITL